MHGSLPHLTLVGKIGKSVKRFVFHVAINPLYLRITTNVRKKLFTLWQEENV